MAWFAPDCFVFPSLADTFGQVIIEALACGLPVAAYSVSGPIDVLGRKGRGPDNEIPATIAALCVSIGLRWQFLGATLLGTGKGSVRSGVGECHGKLLAKSRA